MKNILHSDMNCFYASVEMMLDPSLRGKPVAVCGATEDRHGIVLAKSELAKKAGVKTGMVNWEARSVCRDLVLVPPQYDQYLKYSKLARRIYGQYTDLVEPYGMDECWLDVTGSRYVKVDPVRTAEEIRERIRNELGLTVSIGVSFNKIFAKLGSDMKKPDAVTVITEDSFREKIWPLPASDLLYCGPATTRKLARYGVHTIGQLAETPPGFLQSFLGVNGVALWRFANGLDTSRVMHKDHVSPVKSVGHGITCVADLETEDEVWKVIFQLCQDIGHRLRIHGLSARTVRLYVRGNDLFGEQYQCRLRVKTQLYGEIANAAFALFRERFRWNTNVRAVTVQAADLEPVQAPDQLDLYDDINKRIDREHLQDAVERIRSRFGKASVSYAVLMGDLKMPVDGRDKVRMPGMMYQ